MDNIDCFGNETDIAQCKFNGWGVNNCVHSEDVAVRCNKGKYYHTYSMMSV